MKTNRWIYAIMIASASMGWVACDDDDDNGLDKPNLNDTDEAFVETAAQSNMAEVEFGELASTKASDSLVKAFAQQMISAHTTAQNELKEIRDDYAGVDWPDDLDEGNEDIMDQLQAAEGATFDSLYIRTQVNLHASASSLFENAATNTTDARVKAYANKYLPKIEMHLQKADSIHALIATGTGSETADGGTGTEDGTGGTTDDGTGGGTTDDGTTGDGTTDDGTTGDGTTDDGTTGGGTTDDGTTGDGTTDDGTTGDGTTGDGTGGTTGGTGAG